jgi:hypothetical protein
MDKRNEMIEAISDRKHDVIETWRCFTKMRTLDDEAMNLRRIENSSWRLWFKQKIEGKALSSLIGPYLPSKDKSMSILRHMSSYLPLQSSFKIPKNNSTSSLDAYFGRISAFRKRGSTSLASNSSSDSFKAPGF